MFQPAFDGQSKGDLTPFRDNRRTLRTSTQNTHDLSEHHWNGIFKTPDGITAFLAAMLSLHGEFGTKAAAACGLDGAVAQERARLAALNADLGCDADAPTMLAMKPPMGRDAAWGVLYALNGSALGATVLQRPGAALADQPSRYLALMRTYTQSGELAAFFRALNDQPLDIALAAAGADAVFAAMSGHELGAQK